MTCKIGISPPFVWIIFFCQNQFNAILDYESVFNLDDLVWLNTEIDRNHPFVCIVVSTWKKLQIPLMAEAHKFSWFLNNIWYTDRPANPLKGTLVVTDTWTAVVEGATIVCLADTDTPSLWEKNFCMTYRRRSEMRDDDDEVGLWQGKGKEGMNEWGCNNF